MAEILTTYTRGLAWIFIKISRKLGENCYFNCNFNFKVCFQKNINFNSIFLEFKLIKVLLKAFFVIGNNSVTVLHFLYQK